MKIFLPLITTLLLFSSCKKDENNPIIPEPTPVIHSFTGELRSNDNSTIASADNNLLICGNTPDNICVIKISKTGSQIWRKEFTAGDGSYASGITQTSNLDLFICGSTSRNQQSSMNDVLLIKMNSNGDTLWTKTYGGAKEDYGHYIINTQDGNLLLCGFSYSYTPEGFCDIYLIKVNTNGDTLWTKTYLDADQESPFHILQTQNGEYLVTGTNEDNGSHRELYLLKVSEDGTQLWAKKIGPPIWKWGFSTVELSTGDLLTCGTITVNSYNQILIVKTDNLGNEYWEKEYGDDFLSEQGNALQQNGDGTFIITGSSFEVHSGQHQIILLKIDQNGDQIFFKEFGESSTSSGENIIKDANDDNIITGNYNFNIFMTRTDNNGVFK